MHDYLAEVEAVRSAFGAEPDETLNLVVTVDAETGFPSFFVSDDFLERKPLEEVIPGRLLSAIGRAWRRWLAATRSREEVRTHFDSQGRRQLTIEAWSRQVADLVVLHFADR